MSRGAGAVTVCEEPIARLGEHAQISIAFMVERVLEVSLVDGGLGGMTMSERQLTDPWLKDYDADEDEGPTRWPRRFDVSNWGLIAAYRDQERLGGAVIAYDTAGVNMLGGRSDLAVVWDIRVQPDARAAGIGTLLFRAGEQWARERGCKSLKVETQNINVPACRFYQRMGCTIGAINRFAYADLPAEVQLMWFKTL